MISVQFRRPGKEVTRLRGSVTKRWSEKYRSVQGEQEDVKKRIEGERYYGHADREREGEGIRVLGPGR